MRHKKISYFILFILPLLFSSCSRKQPPLVQLACVNAEEAAVYTAKNADIPIPVGFACRHIEKSEQTVGGTTHYFCYDGAQPATEVVTYLQNRLEHNGWIVSALTTHHSGAFYCCKTNRQLVLVVRPSLTSHSATTLDVYVQHLHGQEDETSLFLDQINAKMVEDMSRYSSFQGIDYTTGKGKIC